MVSSVLFISAWHQDSLAHLGHVGISGVGVPWVWLPLSHVTWEWQGWFIRGKSRSST